jgi:hypothetical protein
VSRSCYSDDYGDDFPGQLELYRANVARSIAGARGQARLRELRDALLAMPEKKLAAALFAPPSGEACALGAWAKRHVQDADAVAHFDGDDNDTAELLKGYGWPRLVVMDLVYENDRDRYVYEHHEGPHRLASAYSYKSEWPVLRARPETDEERYQRVLAWVTEHITEGL